MMPSHIKFAYGSVKSNQSSIYIMIPLTMKPFTFFHNQGKKQPMETGPKK
jgi:hypothetical protein